MGAFLAITASVLLAMGRGFLHFRSVLSNSPFVVFTATSAAVASLQISGGSHLTLPDLWPGIYLMAVTLHVVLAPQFIVRCNSLVPELLSGPSEIQCPHGSYSEFHSFFSFFSPSIEIVYADIRSSGLSWQRGYGSISSPLSPVVVGRGGDPGVLDFARLAVQFPSGFCGLA